MVYPHEGIHPEQSAELAHRMSEMEMNPAPILLVHRGPEAARQCVHDVIATPPDHQFTDRAEHRNRIWAVRDPERLADLATALAPSRALIADGHHRYAAYLRMQESHVGHPGRSGAGHARRPGRHPPVPRRHPPGALRDPPGGPEGGRRRDGRAPGGGLPRGGPRRPGAAHDGRDGRDDVGHAPPALDLTRGRGAAPRRPDPGTPPATESHRTPPLGRRRPRPPAQRRGGAS